MPEGFKDEVIEKIKRSALLALQIVLDGALYAVWYVVQGDGGPVSRRVLIEESS